MPFYTYIVHYKGKSHAIQSQFGGSNFQGDISWFSELPETVFPKPKRNELVGKLMRVQFEEVPNRKHLWSKSVEIDGKTFTVFAVQTVPK